jgi:23S rRNA pseudouridine2605 synthase
MEKVRLNKYIANCGVCTRREADQLIKSSQILVNGQVLTELGIKINPVEDVVSYQGKVLRRTEGVFVLVNKPKSSTVLPSDKPEQVDAFTMARNRRDADLNPLGTLNDKDCGLVLFTDDYNLAQKSLEGIEELFHITLRKVVDKQELASLAERLSALNQPITAIEIGHVQHSDNGNELGVLVQSGYEGTLSAGFESLGYTVMASDRVMFGGLTKKDLPRGRSRILKQNEVAFLKMKI